MKISNGNEKLGSNCYVISRPVGKTCPAGCFFLGNGCYAEKTEKRFPNARKAGFANIHPSVKEITALLDQAEKEGRHIRMQERGDFLLNGKIDYPYIRAWKKALKDRSLSINIWCYTHVYSKEVADLQNYGVKMYASVHNETDIAKAKKAGFSLFAYITTDKRKKGGSHDYAKRIETPLGMCTVCPEQIHGRKNNTKNVTCTGSKDSIACTLCCRGYSNIVFLTH